VEYRIPPGKKLGRFVAPAGSPFIGMVDGDTVLETTVSCLTDLMTDGLELNGETHSVTDLNVLRPIDRPSKIICIGLNYRSHIIEMGADMPKVPIIFTKPSSALIGPDEEILLPAASSRVDFEGEAAFVIGKRARRARQGLEHIFGYTCFNDVTARDLQKTDPDWTRAKGFDTFAPVGPFISATAPTRIETRLNGRTVQESLLSDRVFGEAALVEYISSVMTLEVGDVVATGTPSGIAPMAPGDNVEVELDGVGTLRNTVAGPED
jgi:2-keto-4-pentenoate hydratase/2-oxohepta-3-ene-1,7-dioic acid hydratase in catechol pathway